MLDYTNINGLKEIVADLEKIKADEFSDIRYIREEELDGVINLLEAIIETKEFNEKIR